MLKTTKTKHKRFAYNLLIKAEKEARNALKSGDPILARIRWNYVRYARKNLKQFLKNYAEFKKNALRNVMPLSSEMVIVKGA